MVRGNCGEFVVFYKTACPVYNLLWDGDWLVHPSVPRPIAHSLIRDNDRKTLPRCRGWLFRQSGSLRPKPNGH